MSKPFNIHDWQAKQRQQRLTENMYIDADEFERENLEFDIKRYIGQTFASWMSPSNPPFAQEYAKSPYIDNLAKGISDVVLNRYKTRNEHHNDEDFPGKDLSAWQLLDKIKDGNEDLYNKVEDFMKSMEENVTGGGAAFSGGNSMAHMSHKKKK